MVNKELILLGKALQALFKYNAIDEIKEIIDYMAQTESKSDDVTDKNTKG